MKYRIYSLLLVIICMTFYTCKKIDAQATVDHLPYFNSADFTPKWEKGSHKIPAFSFVNQDSVVITNKTFEGKIYIADFFFTSCSGICPKLTKNMGSLQEKYKDDDDIMLLSHTVMPWKDSISVIKKYAKENFVNNVKWHLVTGDKDQLYSIARKGYFADEDFVKTQDESNFIHTENFILIDKLGYIRGVYNGTLEVDVDRLKRHIKILQKEG
jgi:protein SCO1/2